MENFDFASYFLSEDTNGLLGPLVGKSTKVFWVQITVFGLFRKLAGVFLAVSSNTRYQIINGLERVVEASPIAKQVPPVAMAFTVGVRFANNVYGGMQFVDWARWSGVQ